MSLDVTKLAATTWYILTPQRYFCPKILTMIEMLAVAEFMNNDIPSKMHGQELQFVVKIEIPLRGTAPPAALGIFDGHPIVRHANPLCFIHNHRHQKSPGRLFVIKVRGTFRTWCWCRPSLFGDAAFDGTPQPLHITYDKELLLI